MISVFLKVTENTEVSVREDTQFILEFSSPKKPTKYTVNLIFNTPGVSAELIGLYKLKPEEILDLTTIATHKVPHTSCLQSVRGVLLGNSKSSYVGKIIIEKPAQQTSSFLEHKTLVLGENAINNSQPILEIEADDVKASHGSTTGRINEDQTYYLQSRGLVLEEAKGLIVEGFFEALLGKIRDEKIREKLSRSL